MTSRGKRDGSFTCGMAKFWINALALAFPSFLGILSEMDRSKGAVRRDVHRSFFAVLLSATSAFLAVSAAADTMPLSQIEKGMRGYGLTVFEGTKLEKFNVEILGVLRNIGPGQDLILAKIDSPVVQRAGGIAGMSGSPVFIDGKVIGALAYSWQFAKEPVAGITPIEEMLKIADLGRGTSSAIVAATPRMSASEFLGAIANKTPPELFKKRKSGFAGASPAANMSGLKPIAVPLSLSSFAPETI